LIQSKDPKVGVNTSKHRWYHPWSIYKRWYATSAKRRAERHQRQATRPKIMQFGSSSNETNI